MSNVLAFLNGKKTYLVALVVAVIAVLDVEGVWAAPEWVYLVLGAAGFTTIRMGVSDLKKSLKGE